MQRLSTTIHRSNLEEIKIETRITEHKNAIKRYDYKSLPAAHTYDNCHSFNWTETEQLGRAQTKHEREFKEAWYSIDGNTINRHVEIPTVYLQLKTTRKCPTNNNDTMTNTNFQMTIPSTSATQQSKHSNDAIPSSGIHSTMTTHSSTSNEIRSTTEQPIIDDLNVYKNVATPQNFK